MQQYADESNGEPATKARAMMVTIGNGQFIVGVKIAIKIIDLMENLNRAVLCRQSSVSGMITAMTLTKDNLRQLCTEDKFREIYAETTSMSSPAGSTDATATKTTTRTGTTVRSCCRSSVAKS